MFGPIYIIAYITVKFNIYIINYTIIFIIIIYKYTRDYLNTILLLYKIRSLKVRLAIVINNLLYNVRVRTLYNIYALDIQVGILCKNYTIYCI